MVESWIPSVTKAALFQYNPSGKCLTKVPASPPSLAALWFCQGCGKTQLLPQTCQFLMWYPTAVGSCVLKFMLGFEFLYNLPQEVKAAKQSLCPLTPACAPILSRISLCLRTCTMLYHIITFNSFPAQTYILACDHSPYQPAPQACAFRKHSDLYLMEKCKPSGIHLSNVHIQEGSSFLRTGSIFIPPRQQSNIQRAQLQHHH